MTYVRTDKVDGKYKFIHKVECKQCNTSYERVSANKSPLKQGLCSSECKRGWFRDKDWITVSCTNCDSEFDVRKSVSHKKFCSNKCYYAHMKENPDLPQYNLREKAKNAQAHSNTPESIKKMKQTKLANGDMIDWKDASWKQYWRKCSELTRKMRDVLLEDWDGMDYIDGKYIKDNLTLPHSHGDYPTLDHVVSKTNCYKQGLTPEQACSVENLKWTTRRNNSTKYNK